MKSIYLLALAIGAAFAPVHCSIAASYIEQCSGAPCLAPDGTRQAPGVNVNRIEAADASNPPPNSVLIPDTAGAQIYAPAEPAPTNRELASRLLAGGLQISCVSCGWTVTFPVLVDLDGTLVANNLLSEQLALATSGGTAFADGAATVAWPDTGGVNHTLTPTQFPGFMLSIGAFVARAKAYGNGVPGATLPPASVTIP